MLQDSSEVVRRGTEYRNDVVLSKGLAIRLVQPCLNPMCEDLGNLVQVGGEREVLLYLLERLNAARRDELALCCFNLDAEGREKFGTTL